MAGELRQAADPQLRMWLALYGELPVAAIPCGYRLTPLPPERIEDWAAVLNSTGDLGVWSSERAREAISPGGQAQVLADAVQMAYCADFAVATACLTVRVGDKGAELGWVVVHPAHRRRGLGRLACTAVLRRMRVRGNSPAHLLPDDHRLPAIRLYWDMGFRPEISHVSHSDRWAGLAPAPGRAYPQTDCALMPHTSGD